MPIFVLAHDGGYEGHSPPVQAFTDEAVARSALALLSAHETWNLFAVPLWPEPITEAWYNVKALDSKR